MPEFAQCSTIIELYNYVLRATTRAPSIELTITGSNGTLLIILIPVLCDCDTLFSTSGDPACTGMSPSLRLSCLLRSLQLSEPSFQRAVAQTTIHFTSNQSRWQQRRCETSTSFERYGPAKDLLPPPDKPDSVASEASSASDNARSKGDVDTDSEKIGEREIPKIQDTVIANVAEYPSPVTTEIAPVHAKEDILDKVLEMPAPTSPKKIAPPHLEAPRYVHHFDTYTLVNDLQKGSFSQEQSITIMKAVRGLLAENLELARQGLVSKSDVENESYLFRAACSELRTEIQSARRLNAEKMRSERTLLQYEVDILSQKVTQESLNLKDELKGLFDDRKMAARIEQTGTESRIQEIHYKITSVMAGEAKGEVEGLRWYLTRMLVFTLAGTLCMSRNTALQRQQLTFIVTGIAYLSFSTRRTHKKQERLKKEARESAASGIGPSSSYTTPSRSTSTQTAQTDTVLAEIATEKGSSGSSGYVSLG